MSSPHAKAGRLWLTQCCERGLLYWQSTPRFDDTVRTKVRLANKNNMGQRVQFSKNCGLFRLSDPSQQHAPRMLAVMMSRACADAAASLRLVRSIHTARKRLQSGFLAAALARRLAGLMLDTCPPLLFCVSVS